ncbi:hypothetical protein GQX73_g10678 [Xylaria multiplex]|uniref:Uncharacterized protein n=1 Tax=Xylaria multiplex TaxID=323545 RepID=A0A7C8MZM1_9PEZI|nr:hypothetical protein GQX73_g10678 [Xylaria multiplex]
MNSPTKLAGDGSPSVDQGAISCSPSTRNERDKRQQPPSIQGGETDPLSPTRSDTDESDSSFDTDESDDKVYRIQKVIEDCYYGRPIEHNPTFACNQAQYNKLCKKLDGRDRHSSNGSNLLQYFNESLRVDWSSSAGQLTLRTMVTTIHERTLQPLNVLLGMELDRVGKHPELANLRAKTPETHGVLGKVEEEKSPDSQFCFEDGKNLPTTFVIEIACSQTEHDLSKKTQIYFEKLHVCTVLSIKIYSTQRRSHASYYLYTTSKLGNKTVVSLKKQPFRNNGQALEGELVIPFSAFLPLQLRNATSETEQLRISFRTLSDIVDGAERAHRLRLYTEMNPLPPRKIQYDFESSRMLGN